MKEDKTVLWRMSCEYANWSNNPFLCSKEWFLELAVKVGFKEMISPPNSRSPDFEESVEANGWWQETKLYCRYFTWIICTSELRK